MVELDDTDLQILQLLAEDSRRPYSEIADEVGVSPPTVSDRIDRLEERGVIERFTLDIDQSTIEDGVRILVDLELQPTAVEDAIEQLAPLECVEHVFATVDAHVVVNAIVPEPKIRPTLDEAIDFDRVINYDVRILSASVWKPCIDGADVEALREETDEREAEPQSV